MNSVFFNETQIVSETHDAYPKYVESLWGEMEESNFSILNPQQLAAVEEALADASCALSAIATMLRQKDCWASLEGIPMLRLGEAMSDMAGTIAWELEARERLRASDPDGYHDLYSRYNADYLG